MSYEDFQKEQTEKLGNIFTQLDAEGADAEKLKESITDLLESQAKYGKTQYDKKQSQIKKFESVLGAIGYEDDKYENVTEFAESFKKKNENMTDAEREKQELLDKVTRLEANEQKREENEQKLKRENERSKMTSALQEAIGEQLQASNYIIKDLINEEKVKVIDGEVMFVNKDGEAQLFDDGVKKVLEDNAPLVKGNQKGGADTTKTTTVDGKQTAGLTRESINEMSPEEIKANMAEIKKMAGVR